MAQRTFMAHAPGSRAKKGTVEVVVPTVVGVTRAAEMLRVPKSNITRLRMQGRMPEPLPRPEDGEGQSLDSGAPVWLEAEVQTLADELEAERAERRERGAHADNGD